MHKKKEVCLVPDALNVNPGEGPRIAGLFICTCSIR